MSRITPSGTVTPFAPQATSTNGMAVDAARGEFYVDSTFNAKTVISVISLAGPNATLRTYTIPGIGPLNSADDLTLGVDGNLYVALNVGGKVVRVDPVTGAQCTIASGLPLVSSVRFGSGPGWDPASLYATSFTGTVTRLRP
ncbi:MAG: SMP-30/gluconolactonase/LRE family protein, partial [Marmoricola sp.]